MNAQVSARELFWRATALGFPETCAEEEPEQGKLGYFTEPVVCWVLVEASDGHRFVTAMAPDLETSELKLMLGIGNFLGYATPTSSPDWMQLASNKRAENQAHLP
jgi:hypothetical protein